MIVRNAREADKPTIHAVIGAAFGRLDEANLVDALHAAGEVLISLVAEHDDDIVGHVLFSRMWIDTQDGSVNAVALAPVAVRPASQQQGIGTMLIRQGLDALRLAGERIVIVLGHPGYYPRFGFSAARTRTLESPFSGPALMALELEEGALHTVRGRVRYPAAFGV